MKQHKLIVFSILLIIYSTLNAQTQVSPYVENGNTVNNSGFNASMLRSTALTRPVAPHLSTDAINNKVSPKFLVATSDYNSSNTILWAQACGWTAASNTNTSSAIVASPVTGCNQYLITAKPKDEFSEPVALWYDEGRIELLKENYISESDVSSADTGFDIMPNKGTRGK